MRVLGLLLATSLALGATFVTPSPPWAVSFVDVAERAGLRQPSVYGGLEQKRFIIETNGAGVAFVDVDNDGWVDALVLNGTRLAEGKREDQVWPRGQAPTSHLYRNDHDGTFTDITAQAGLTKTGWASSVCAGDYDNDGWLDLFVTYYGRNVLYHNRGQGRFEDATAQAGFPTTGTRWGSGCSFIDYDRDGKLDLFVSNYLAFDLQTALEPGQGANCLWKGIPVNCGPKGLATDTNLLYHNDGDGRFRDVSTASGVDKAKNRYPMTAAAADLDGDGWTDLYVACDSTSAIFYRNNQDGTFTDRALESGTGYSEYGNAQAGMGLAVGDFDGDGQIDLLKTHFADDIPALYRNLGRGQFEDVATAVGLGARNRHVEWGAGLPDLDNDGRPDIFYVTGNVYPEIERHFKEYPHRGPRVVFRNVDGTRFEDVTERSGPGAAVPHSSRGAAFGDFDNDGDLDVLVMNMNEPPTLLRNDAPRANGWIEVKLEGTRSNRAGLGATVTVTTGGRKQTRAALSQTSYYSHDDLRLHFGLGAAAAADMVEVRWPSGLVDRLEHVAGRRVVAIRESGSAPAGVGSGSGSVRFRSVRPRSARERRGRGCVGRRRPRPDRQVGSPAEHHGSRHSAPLRAHRLPHRQPLRPGDRAPPRPVLPTRGRLLARLHRSSAGRRGDRRPPARVRLARPGPPRPGARSRPRGGRAGHTRGCRLRARYGGPEARLPGTHRRSLPGSGAHEGQPHRA